MSGDDDGGPADRTGDAGRETAGAGSGKWRCAWCEKPHDRNDPPCDNCGHHKFERAVVPVAPSDPDYQREPVWVCPECGRQHQKNSPPCSRCGHPTLEKRIPDDADFDDELGGTSYADVLEPKYAVAAVFAVVAGGVLLLGLLGVVSLPGMGGDSLAVSNVPGNATTAEGLSLAEVESEYVALLVDRAEQDGESLTRNDNLDDVARFYNQRLVKNRTSGRSLPGDGRLLDAIGDTCGPSPMLAPIVVLGDTGIGSFDSEREVAREIGALGPISPSGKLGVDVHAFPDGRVAVTAIYC